MAFTLQSVVLLTEVRVCTCCGSRYEFPSNVMLKLYNERGATVYSTPHVDFLAIGLPREVHFLKTRVPACKQCFLKGEPDANQLGLFEQPHERQKFEMGKISLDGVTKSVIVKALRKPNERLNWVGGPEGASHWGPTLTKQLNGTHSNTAGGKTTKKKQPPAPKAVDFF